MAVTQLYAVGSVEALIILILLFFAGVFPSEVLCCSSALRILCFYQI